MNRICLQWPRFGPYHLARIEAAHRRFGAQGVEVIGLETAGDDATYDWAVEGAPVAFRREQVFPSRLFETIPSGEMHTGVTAALDRLDPDAVAITSYSFPDARACLAWCRRNRRVAVLMSASKEDDAERVAWRERIKALLVRQYDAALVGGTPQRRYLEHLSFAPERIFTGYNAVDNAFFQEQAEAARRDPSAFVHLPGLTDTKPYFVASNRFVPRKNLDRLLLAYHAYRTAVDQPWRLLLLGDGPERPHLEALIRAHQIDGVALCGFRQYADLPVYYGLAGALIHPTLQDQWALVVNEAMAAGLPVLVSDRAGCATDLVVEGQTGFSFDPEDTVAMTNCMLRMTASETDRTAMGRRAQAHIAGWSPEQFAEGLWSAVEAGRPQADRGFGLVPSAALQILRLLARSAKAFHSVQE